MTSTHTPYYGYVENAVLDNLELSVRADRVLRMYGRIKTLDDFMALTKKQVMALKGAGARTWREIADIQQNLRDGHPEVNAILTDRIEAPDLARTVMEQAAMLERMAEALDYMCRVTDHVREWHRGDTNSRVNLMVKIGCAITNEDEARAMLAAYRAQTGGEGGKVIERRPQEKKASVPDRLIQYISDNPGCTTHDLVRDLGHTRATIVSSLGKARKIVNIETVKAKAGVHIPARYWVTT